MQEPLDPMRPSLLAFLLHQFQQEVLVAERFLRGTPRPLFKAAEDRGQVQLLQILVEFGTHVARLAHCITPLLNRSSKVFSDTSSTATSVTGETTAACPNRASTAWRFSLPTLISPCSSSARRASSTRASPSRAARCRISRYRFGACGVCSRSASQTMRKRLEGNNSSR